MKEIKGDFWDCAPDYEVLCVTTNGVVKSNNNLVMGGGIARQFRNRYVTLASLLGNHVLRAGNVPKLTNFIDSPSVLSIPTKNEWTGPSPISLVLKSAVLAVRLLDQTSFTKILSVQPGCGLGGLDWKEVKPVLEKAGWDDRFTIISPPPKKKWI